MVHSGPLRRRRPTWSGLYVAETLAKMLKEYDNRRFKAVPPADFLQDFFRDAKVRVRRSGTEVRSTGEDQGDQDEWSIAELLKKRNGLSSSIFKLNGKSLKGKNVATLKSKKKCSPPYVAPSRPCVMSKHSRNLASPGGNRLLKSPSNDIIMRVPETNIKKNSARKWKRMFRLGGCFLDLCRLREFAEGLRASCRRLETEPSKATVMLYLLTGHLRPANEPLLTEFLASADFNEVASVVYNLDRLKPIERFYYKSLFETNLYSKEVIHQWAQKNEMDGGYSEKFMKKVKEIMAGELNRKPEPTRLIKWNLTKPDQVRQNRDKATLFTTSKGLTSTSNTTQTGQKCRENARSSDISRRTRVSPKKIQHTEQKPISKEQRVPRTISKGNEKVFTIIEGGNRDSMEEPPFDIQKECEREKLGLEDLQYRLERREYNSAGLFKARTVLGCPTGRNSEYKNQSIMVRTNASSILKEAAVILKAEENENKKILGLMIGSSNYLEYEKMIEERIKGEQELFVLNIRRLNLQGKLTYQAAVLAKARLLNESKERRRQFEMEREKFLQDMNDLRAREQEKLSAITTKVKEIRDRAIAKKEALQEHKKQQVEILTKEIQNALKEAMMKKKQELSEKILMIKELRTVQAIRKSFHTKNLAESPKFGLLSEMSLEELQERKKIMKQEIEEQITIRRNQILEQIKCKEMFLDNAEQFIRESRSLRQTRKLASLKQKENLKEPSMNVEAHVFKTFTRPVPQPPPNEELYKKIKNELEEIEKCRKEILKNKRNNCMKEKAYEEIESDKRLRVSMGKRYGTVSENKKLECYSFITTVRKRNSSLKGSPQPENDIIWGKFKNFINNNTFLKLPKKLAKLRKPPNEWHYLPKLNVFQTRCKPAIKENKKRKRKRKRKLRYEKYSTTGRLIRHPGVKSVTRGKGKYKKWMTRWRKFYLGFKDAQVRAQQQCKLENIDHEYTKNVISQVRYYYGLLNKEKYEKEKVNQILQKEVNKIEKMKVHLKITAEMIRNARSTFHKTLTKAFNEPGKLKPPKPKQRNRMLFTAGLSEGGKFEERVIKIPHLDEIDDREIKESTIHPPFQPVQTNKWLTEEEYQHSRSWWNVKAEQNESERVERKEKKFERGIPLWRVRKEIRKRETKKVEPLPKRKPSYCYLLNTFGNPVFLLKQALNDSLKWYWNPVKVRKVKHHFRSERIVPRCIIDAALSVDPARSEKDDTQTSRFLLVLEALKLKNKFKGVHQRFSDPEEMRKYYRNVPLKMILRYFKTHPFGGDPNK